ADAGAGPTNYTGKKYQIDPRIASLVTIDSPLDDVKRMPSDMGAFLAANTRIKTGSQVPQNKRTALTVDVPVTVVESEPVTGIDNNDRPNYGLLGGASCAGNPICRHERSGRVSSPDTSAFLERVWK
ncbi:MAG TPA: hypothetical protein VEX13_06190, partial [Chloroflexia bacterium]|nr:hypothetical protein [Chloroflexia bacterium]